MAKVFKKHVCTNVKCRRWKMKSGICSGCGATLVEAEKYSIVYQVIDQDGIKRKKVEDAKTKSVRAVQRLLEQRMGEAANGEVEPVEKKRVTFDHVAKE